jgi:putative endonuclease
MGMNNKGHAYIYIMTNKYNTVLYTGVANDLAERVDQHKSNPSHGFTGRYNAKKLVYVEAAEDMDQALFREKQIKAGSRQNKIDLVNSVNPNWDDLSETI